MCADSAGIRRKGYTMSKAETTAYELNDYALTNWDATVEYVRETGEYMAINADGMSYCIGDTESRYSDMINTIDYVCDCK